MLAPPALSPLPFSLPVPSRQRIPGRCHTLACGLWHGTWGKMAPPISPQVMALSGGLLKLAHPPCPLPATQWPLSAHACDASEALRTCRQPVRWMTGCSRVLFKMCLFLSFPLTLAHFCLSLWGLAVVWQPNGLYDLAMCPLEVASARRKVGAAHTVLFPGLHTDGCAGCPPCWCARTSFLPPH